MCVWMQSISHHCNNNNNHLRLWYCQNEVLNDTSSLSWPAVVISWSFSTSFPVSVLHLHCKLMKNLLKPALGVLVFSGLSRFIWLWSSISLSETRGPPQTGLRCFLGWALSINVTKAGVIIELVCVYVCVFPHERNCEVCGFWSDAHKC